VTDWIIDTALGYLGYNHERMLSLAELCWWAVSVGVGGEITEEMARRSLKLKDEGFKSVYRESDIVPSVPATSILAQRVTTLPPPPTAPQLSPAQPKPVVSVLVDSEAPATFLPGLNASAGSRLIFSCGLKLSPACAVASLLMMLII
jgi:hypothetical protein